jgi:hypothetical protein
MQATFLASRFSTEQDSCVPTTCLCRCNSSIFRITVSPQSSYTFILSLPSLAFYKNAFSMIPRLKKHSSCTKFVRNSSSNLTETPPLSLTGWCLHQLHVVPRGKSIKAISRCSVNFLGYLFSTHALPKMCLKVLRRYSCDHAEYVVVRCPSQGQTDHPPPQLGHCQDITGPCKTCSAGSR